MSDADHHDTDRRDGGELGDVAAGEAAEVDLDDPDDYGYVPEPRSAELAARLHRAVPLAVVVAAEVVQLSYPNPPGNRAGDPPATRHE